MDVKLLVAESFSSFFFLYIYCAPSKSKTRYKGTRCRKRRRRDQDICPIGKRNKEKEITESVVLTPFQDQGRRFLDKLG